MKIKNYKLSFSLLIIAFFCILWTADLAQAVPPTAGKISPYYEYTNQNFKVLGWAESQFADGMRWCLQYPGSDSWNIIGDTTGHTSSISYTPPTYPNGVFPGEGTLKLIVWRDGAPLLNCSLEGEGGDYSVHESLIYFKNSTPICNAYPETASLYRGEGLAGCLGAPGADSLGSINKYSQSTKDPDDLYGIDDMSFKWTLYSGNTEVAHYDDSNGVACYNLTSAQTAAFDPGNNYSVEFRASDCGEEGDCDVIPNDYPYCQDTLSLEILNKAPISKIEPSFRSVSVNNPVDLTATITDPESDYDIDYTWSTNNVPLQTGSLSSGETTSTVNIVPTSKGAQTISLQTIDLDGAGASSMSYAGIDVINQPPRNTLIYPKYAESYVGEIVTFSSSTANDPDNDDDDLSYTMFLLDDISEELTNDKIICQSTGNATNCAYTPTEVGSKLVALMINDNDVTGPSYSVDYASLVVKNHSPSVAIQSLTGLPDISEPLTLTAIASDEDNGPGVMTYTWSENDIAILGCVNTPQNTCTIPVSGLSTGEHTYKVEVNDNSGSNSEPATASDTILVEFYNSTPVAGINTPDSQLFERTKVVSAGSTFSLNGSARDADYPSNLSYVWSLSDTNGAKIGGCSGSLSFTTPPYPLLPDCENLTVSETGQYYATLSLEDNEDFPSKNTDLERIAIFAVTADDEAWMEKGTVTVDNEDPVYSSGLIDGFVSDGSREYISGRDSAYADQDSYVAETSAIGTDAYSGLRYASIKLVEDPTGDASCSDNSVYTYKYLVDLNEPDFYTGPMKPLLGFAFAGFDEDLSKYYLDIMGGQDFSTEEAHKFRVCYKFEDMTAYKPVEGNSNTWVSGELSKELVLDIVKPEITGQNADNGLEIYDTSSGDYIAECVNGDWWTNQTDLEIQGTIDDQDDNGWESSGISDNALELVITPDEEGASEGDPITISVDNNNDWDYSNLYAEEHPILNFSGFDAVGNEGKAKCIPHIDTSEPGFLSSNPEDGWLMLNPDSKIELFISEPTNSAYLDNDYIYPTHGLVETSILPNENIRLYDVTGETCQSKDFSGDDFSISAASTEDTYLIRVSPDTGVIENHKDYRVVLNGADCGESDPSTLIQDKAGNYLSEQVIDFSTPQGATLLSIQKKVFDQEMTKTQIITAKTDKNGENEIVTYQITLKNDNADNFGAKLDSNIEIRDILPPYFEYEASTGSYSINEGTSTNIIPVPDDELNEKQGQSLTWTIPAELPVGSTLKITYNASLNSAFIPEALK